MRDGYYIEANAGIYFAPPTPPNYNEVALFQESTNGAPVVQVWGSCDAKGREEMPLYLQGNAIMHSTKYKVNVEAPFLEVARVLMQDTGLQFVEAPAIAPPVVFPRLSAKI